MKVEDMAQQFADNISGLELTCSLLAAKDKSHAYRLGRYDGFLAGFKACTKERLNATTISDCPIKDDQLAKAKEHIKQLLDCLKQDTNGPETNYYVCQYMDKAEQFLKEIEK